MPDASRPSRMIHRSITTSERLALVSDSAFRLYVLLLVNQDDEGRYPWTPYMVRALIVGTNWTHAQADEYLAELVRVESVSSMGPLLTIRRGAELNGIPNGSARWKQCRRYAAESVAYSVRTGYAQTPGSVNGKTG